MPFTVSHAVVALPFVRTPLVPAAIAVGAMIPDLPMFWRPLGAIGVTYARTHDYAWIPLTALIALLALLLWRCVLRPAATELAPRWIAERLPRSWSIAPRAALREVWTSGRSVPTTVVVLAVSLGLGVLSHILWDSFTHEGRGGTVLAGLDARWGALPAYKWLQYGSGVMGVIVIVLWAALWWRRQPIRPLRRRLSPGVRVAWWVSLPIVLVVAGAFVVAGGPPAGESFAAGHLVYGVLPALGGWGLATLALCVVVALRSRPQE